jgi:protease-4
VTPPPRWTRPRCRIALALLGCAICGSARAQTADPEARPTRGVHVPNAARAGDADPTGVQENPAQLGLLRAPGLDVAIDLNSRTAPLPGRGLGVFAATPIFGASGLGLGLSRVGSNARFGTDAHTTMQLGYALGLGRFAALGASWVHVWGSSFAGTDTFDLAASARFGRWAALGVVVEDVSEPKAAAPAPGLPRPELPRLWAGELVVRPLGTQRLELAVGASHVQDQPWRWVAPRARLGVTVVPGLRLFATGTTLPRGTEYAFASGADYAAELGLAFDFDHAGLTAGARGAWPGTGGGDEGEGASFLLRAEGLRREPLVAPAVVIRLSLEHVSNDAAFLELVRRLRGLAVDRTVAAVLLKLDDVPFGMGRIEEVRDLIGLLRARGKRVYAYGAFPSTREYYLATACDAILIHPAGTLSLTGFSQTVTFYKRLMDTIGVNVDLVRIAEYKGAMEPFVFEEQSAPVRANKNDLLDDIYRRLVAAVARARTGGGRVLDEARVRTLIERGLFTPFEAQLVGLVDAVKDETEIEPYLRSSLGRPYVSVRDADKSPTYGPWPSRRVVVILADGTIVDGKSRRFPFGEDLTGADTLVEALEECRRDPTVGAVVLRVNSPGGSAFGSDVVARAVRKVRAAGKPVVASMGDMAASGGYYISAPTDVIFAEPSTISGSIGIFGYKVDIRKLMATLGLGVETYRRGQHADYNSPFRPWTDDEIKIAAEKIRYFYDLFIGTVAEGRKAQGLTRARVDEIGRGHVWTGAEARGLGLVDELGGVSAAIDRAAKLGHVPLNRDGLPELKILPRPTGGLLQLLLGLNSTSASANGTAGDDAAIADSAPAVAPELELLRSRLARPGVTSALRLLAPLLFGNGSGIEARLPYDLEIR